MIELVLAIFMLIGGLGLIIYCSIHAVKHSAILAAALGISPLVIGVALVSIGTDISEIFNSIISCSLGHGDIDVGDSVGSGLTQLTLIFGIGMGDPFPTTVNVYRVQSGSLLVIMISDDLKPAGASGMNVMLKLVVSISPGCKENIMPVSFMLN